MTSPLPLLRRIPALASIPRAPFGSFPTPVTTIELEGGAKLWVKRDDQSGPLIGGNKVRGLEWVLGRVQRGDRIVTVGPRGSTHALATATCAKSLGVTTTVVRWSQKMNDAARQVDARMYRVARVVDMFFVPPAYALANTLRMTGARFIGAGGATPLSLLGHANAALELVEQAGRREFPMPTKVFVPFGTGSTAAGLALGFRIAGLSTRVVAVRVVPFYMGRLRKALNMARRTRRLIERMSDARIPKITSQDLVVEHDFYAGRYGRPLKKPSEHEQSLSLTGIRLDDTYSRKAFAAAATLAAKDHADGGDERVMFWMTFDSRLLG